MKVKISPQAETDITRQFRYYLVDTEAPLVALRYREAVMETVNRLPDNPNVGKPIEGSIPGLRSWPVKGFEAIRIYYRQMQGELHVIRLLHGKRNVRVRL